MVMALERPSGTTMQHPGVYLRWLVPATAAFILLCMVSNQRHGGSATGGTNSGAFLAVISSNQSSYLAPGALRQQNRPSTDTFDWTNDSTFTSSVRSLLGPKAQH